MFFKIFFIFLSLIFSLTAEEQPQQLKPLRPFEKSKEISKHAEDKSKKPKKPKTAPENSPPPSTNLSKPKGSE